ncbi:hypothetical protein [Desulfobacula sp.]|uniref:hypothetical protein n=1 Tax=Desulfobacula sp. TaxID=2593537 RepID=UPI002609E101|nr:hypothetical protein [Desulfobacula sp.]
MDINSLNGSTTYTNIPNGTPPVDNTRLPEQNAEASSIDLNTDTSPGVPKAFEVTLSREALDRLAAEPATTPTSTPQPLDNPINQNMEPAVKASQIVNIVA